MRLMDKVAIVTGATSRGIGHAIAIRFARNIEELSKKGGFGDGTKTNGR